MALHRLETDLNAPDKDQVLNDLRNELRKS
jgi:hypothetical protein